MTSEQQMMMAVTAFAAVLPPEPEIKQWLADVETTIDSHAGDTEALAFLVHLRSVLLLMLAGGDVGRSLIAASAVLAMHAARYEDATDEADRRLLAWRGIWETMAQDSEIN